MLNLDLLRVFISVAENSSFTRAASELNRSQSAISMQIKRLEEIVGAPVLVRDGKTVILSREGTILLDYARAYCAWWTRPCPRWAERAIPIPCGSDASRTMPREFSRRSS